MEGLHIQLSDALVRGEAAVVSAVAAARAESASEIQKLKSVVAQLPTILADVRRVKRDFRDFSKSTHRLPRWFKKLIANFSQPVR